LTAVADSSPLIIMAKLRCFDLLNRLFPRIYISEEVRNEVVLGGAGLPGASEVSKAEWIEVKQLRNQADLLAAQQRYALGVGGAQYNPYGKGAQCERRTAR
jgi:predicted nucleic acid-binding protein